MKKEDKDLLLKDLCARLPYGVIVSCAEGTVMGVHWNKVKLDASLLFEFQNNDALSNVKPYLRPISSMIEEENKEFESIWDNGFGKALDTQISNFDDCVIRNLEIIASSNAIDWLLKHHFDFRGLIERGLAIEVTIENNPYKE